MLEHVRSENPLVGPLIDLINPLPLYVYGANINRRTLENLERAGFHDIQAKNLWQDILKEITVQVHDDELDSPGSE